MEEVTEFYPLPHVFDSTVFGHARFAHRSHTDDIQKPAFLYRFDTKYLEIRDIVAAEHKVFASVHAKDLAQVDEELDFTNVAYAVINQEPSLLVCARNSD